MSRDILEELKVLDSKEVKIYKDDSGVLKARVEGRDYLGVKASRAFPLSDMWHFIGLSDEKSNEIGLIRDLEGLDPESRRVLREELERAYFIPKILTIYDLSEEFGVSRWDVETDKGPRTFEVRGKRDNIRILGRRRVIIDDVDGNRFEIEDYQGLDRRSRFLVEPYL